MYGWVAAVGSHYCRMHPQWSFCRIQENADDLMNEEGAVTLQEKRRDLDGEKRKVLLQRLLSELSNLDPNLYYQSTSQVALSMCAYIDGDAKLVQEERQLLQGLAPRDIEVLLSLH